MGYPGIEQWVDQSLSGLDVRCVFCIDGGVRVQKKSAVWRNRFR